MSGSLSRTYSVDGRTHTVKLRQDGLAVRGELDENAFHVDAELIRPLRGGADLLIGAGVNAERAVVVRDGDTVFVAFRGRVHRVSIASARGADVDHHETDEDDFAASPMTGVVLKVTAEAGDRLADGAPLFVVEAMKMEFVVEAPRDLEIAEVRVAAGDRVDIGQILATFVPPEEPA